MTDDEKRSRSTKWQKKGAGSGDRALKQRVKTARGRRLSSTRWLERQLNDPYVAAAKRAGYRSRAAFKLAEIDDRFGFLKPGGRVLDLGAAPGGWTQVAVSRVKCAGAGGGQVVALDLLEMDPIAGAVILQLDFMNPGVTASLLETLQGPVDVVLSDMAAPATGHKQTDHARIIGLCEAGLEFAFEVLKPGGTFVAKVLQGGTETALLNRMKRHFTSVRHVKPKASRADSAEMYVVALGYRPGDSPA